LNLKQILESDNLADQLDHQENAAISKHVSQRYEYDLNSRSDKQKRLKEIVDLALCISKGKSTPWENCSNIIFPLTAMAANEFSAFCYPEIIKDEEIVKAKIIGKDTGTPAINNAGEIMTGPNGEPIMQNEGAKYRRGQRVATYMNWQLFKQMSCWQKEMDTMFTALPVVGTMFKKIFYNPVKQIPDSQLIFPDRIIIHDKARDLEHAPVTQVIELYEQEIIERIRKGIFIDFKFDEDVGDYIESKLTSLEDNSRSSSDYSTSGQHIFLEQHCFYDLDHDGYPEPYVVTWHQMTNTIVRMVPRFREKDITYNSKDQVSYIKPVQFFEAYIFMPSPDGSFYGQGLGHLLYNVNMAINSSINQLTDAGTLGNLGGGFISKNMKIVTGETKFRPGEWKVVDAMGMDIQDGLVPLPAPQPSSVLLSLLTFLTDAGKELGLLRGMLGGEQAANIAPTTQMIQTDNALKPFRAIFKRIYNSLAGELDKLFKLNREYVSNKQYLKVLDETAATVDVKADFESDDYDIVPVADLDALTNIQRMNQSAFLMNFINDPYFNGMDIRKTICEGANIPNLDKLIVQPPQPQPDPLVQMEMVKQQNKGRELEIEAVKVAGQLEDAKYKTQEIIANIELMKTQGVKNLAEADAKDKSHHLAAYEAELAAIHRQIESEMMVRDQELKEKQHQDQIEQQQQQLMATQQQPEPSPVNSQITD
jgi:chaperonin GroES